jgi:Glycosyl transferase family 2
VSATPTKFMEKVSVIIPAYNAALYIGETIESVQGQSWKNLEIIIVNDGSTDSTETIIQSYLADSRIKYVYQDNHGCSHAKNTGLSAATGDFIQYLDADDILSSEKIAEQVKALSNDVSKVAVCKTYVFSDSGSMTNLTGVDPEYLYSTDDALGFLLNLYGMNGKRGMIQPNAFLIPNALAVKAGPWNTSISPAPDEDGEYFCRVILCSTGIRHVDNVYNYYRKTSGKQNLSSKHDLRHAVGSLQSIRLKTKHILQAENSTRVRRVMASEFAAFMYLYYSQYRKLALEAHDEVRLLTGEQIPLAGGKTFRYIAGIVGMNYALQLKAMRDTLFFSKKLSY